MHNLWTVVAFEFTKTVKKKTFWISVLAVPFLISAIFALSYFSNKTAAANKSKNESESFSLAVLDESGIITQSQLDTFGATRLDNKEAGIAQVKDGRLDAFLFVPADPAKEPLAVYARDIGLTKNSKYTTVARSLLRQSIIGELGSPEQAAILEHSPAANLIAYKNGAIVPGIEQVILPAVYLVLFYLLIILMGNQMLTSTTEEKENRVIEIILTTVDAGSLIIGKILAMIMVAALQVSLILAPVVTSFIFFRDKLNFPQVDLSALVIDPVRLLTGGLIFIFSFLLFAGMLVTIGSMVPTAKEASGFFGIAVFFMFVPLYAAAPIVTDPSQTIVRIFSNFPLSAPITLLLRNAVGNLSTGQAVIGIAILAVSGLAALWLATRAFRQGTLEYEHKLNLARIFRK